MLTLIQHKSERTVLCSKNILTHLLYQIAFTLLLNYTMSSYIVIMKSKWSIMLKSSASLRCVREKRILWQDCASAQTRLSLPCSHMRYVLKYNHRALFFSGTWYVLDPILQLWHSPL